MADDVVGIVLVLLEEVGDTREGDLVDILVDLLLGHADTVVADGNGAFVGIEIHTDGEVAQIALEIALLLKGLHLLRGIDSIGNHLTEEDLVIAIKKLLDDWKNVLSRYANITFLHSFYIFTFLLFYLSKHHANTVPNKK